MTTRLVHVGEDNLESLMANQTHIIIKMLNGVCIGDFALYKGCCYSNTPNKIRR